MNCPNGHGSMKKKTRHKKVPYKGDDVDITEESFVCPVCNLWAGTVQTAGKIQISIVSAYQEQGEVNATQNPKP
jgi:C4-type Zn-finger protein